MNQKQAKKLRQIYRRDFREKLNSEYIFAIVKKSMKQKPKHMPQFLWEQLAHLYFKKRVIDSLFNKEKRR